MTTEPRHRAAINLDVSDFKPVEKPLPPIPKKEVSDLAKAGGFRSTNSAAEEGVDQEAQQASSPTTTRASKPKPVKYVRIAFDVPDALRQALQDGSRKNGLGTVRAVILDALKSKGYPVSDDELLDKRTRR